MKTNDDNRGLLLLLLIVYLIASSTPSSTLKRLCPFSVSENELFFLLAAIPQNAVHTQYLVTVLRIRIIIFSSTSVIWSLHTDSCDLFFF